MGVVSSEEASLLLLSGNIVAIPTETVYGLAGSIESESAIEQIFALKKRPKDNPLIVHLPSVEYIKQYVSETPPYFEELSQSFWPGPLTIILPIRENVLSSSITAGLQTCAFRIPSQKESLALLEKTGPLVAPSANISGRPSSTKIEHIQEDFGAFFPVLAGECGAFGIESTIIGFENGWKVLRLGAISIEELTSILPEIEEYNGTNLSSPGRKYKHYSPSCRLSLSPTPSSDVIIGYSDRSYPETSRLFLLGSSKEPLIIMKNLYATLRDLDLEGIREATIDNALPEKGLYQSILERISRASCQY